MSAAAATAASRSSLSASDKSQILASELSNLAKRKRKRTVQEEQEDEADTAVDKLVNSKLDEEDEADDSDDEYNQENTTMFSTTQKVSKRKSRFVSMREQQKGDRQQLDNPLLSNEDKMLILSSSYGSGNNKRTKGSSATKSPNSMDTGSGEEEEDEGGNDDESGADTIRLLLSDLEHLNYSFSVAEKSTWVLRKLLRENSLLYTYSAAVSSNWIISQNNSQFSQLSSLSSASPPPPSSSVNLPQGLYRYLSKMNSDGSNLIKDSKFLLFSAKVDQEAIDSKFIVAGKNGTGSKVISGLDTNSSALYGSITLLSDDFILDDKNGDDSQFSLLMKLFHNKLSSSVAENNNKSGGGGGDKATVDTLLETFGIHPFDELINFDFVNNKLDLEKVSGTTTTTTNEGTKKKKGSGKQRTEYVYPLRPFDYNPYSSTDSSGISQIPKLRTSNVANNNNKIVINKSLIRYLMNGKVLLHTYDPKLDPLNFKSGNTKKEIESRLLFLLPTSMFIREVLFIMNRSLLKEVIKRQSNLNEKEQRTIILQKKEIVRNFMSYVPVAHAESYFIGARMRKQANLFINLNKSKSMSTSMGTYDSLSLKTSLQGTSHIFLIVRCDQISATTSLLTSSLSKKNNKNDKQTKDKIASFAKNEKQFYLSKTKLADDGKLYPNNVNQQDFPSVVYFGTLDLMGDSDSSLSNNINLEEGISFGATSSSSKRPSPGDFTGTSTVANNKYIELSPLYVPRSNIKKAEVDMITSIIIDEQEKKRFISSSSSLGSKKKESGTDTKDNKMTTAKTKKKKDKVSKSKKEISELKLDNLGRVEKQRAEARHNQWFKAFKMRYSILDIKARKNNMELDDDNELEEYHYTYYLIENEDEFDKYNNKFIELLDNIAGAKSVSVTNRSKVEKELSKRYYDKFINDATNRKFIMRYYRMLKFKDDEDDGSSSSSSEDDDNEDVEAKFNEALKLLFEKDVIDPLKPMFDKYKILTTFSGDSSTYSDDDEEDFDDDEDEMDVTSSGTNASRLGMKEEQQEVLLKNSYALHDDNFGLNNAWLIHRDDVYDALYKPFVYLKSSVVNNRNVLLKYEGSGVTQSTDSSSSSFRKVETVKSASELIERTELVLPVNAGVVSSTAAAAPSHPGVKLVVLPVDAFINAVENTYSPSSSSSSDGSIGSDDSVQDLVINSKYNGFFTKVDEAYEKFTEVYSKMESIVDDFVEVVSMIVKTREMSSSSAELSTGGDPLVDRILAKKLYNWFQYRYQLVANQINSLHIDIDSLRKDIGMRINKRSERIKLIDAIKQRFKDDVTMTESSLGNNEEDSDSESSSSSSGSESGDDDDDRDKEERTKLSKNEEAGEEVYDSFNETQKSLATMIQGLDIDIDTDIIKNFERQVYESLVAIRDFIARDSDENETYALIWSSKNDYVLKDDVDEAGGDYGGGEMVDTKPDYDSYPSIQEIINNSLTNSQKKLLLVRLLNVVDPLVNDALFEAENLNQSIEDLADLFEIANEYLTKKANASATTLDILFFTPKVKAITGALLNERKLVIGDKVKHEKFLLDERIEAYQLYLNNIITSFMLKTTPSSMPTDDNGDDDEKELLIIEDGDDDNSGGGDGAIEDDPEVKETMKKLNEYLLELMKLNKKFTKEMNNQDTSLETHFNTISSKVDTKFEAKKYINRKSSDVIFNNLDGAIGVIKLQLQKVDDTKKPLSKPFSSEVLRRIRDYVDLYITGISESIVDLDKNNNSKEKVNRFIDDLIAKSKFKNRATLIKYLAKLKEEYSVTFPGSNV